MAVLMNSRLVGMAALLGAEIEPSAPNEYLNLMRLSATDVTSLRDVRHAAA
jgi:hypothetical protein